MLNVGKYMDDYRDEMIGVLSQLVSCQSVQGDSLPNAPFGQGNRDALDCFLSYGEKFGLKVFDADGYAGHVEYGDGDEVVASLTHLDIVPTGDLDKWNSDPYTLVNRDGVLYGRGVCDDKGCAVATLFALKMFLDKNIKLDRKIRAIVGCGEETASNDIEYYLERTTPPIMSFTPDADFPIINREKGRLLYKFHISYTGDSVINRLVAGDAPNVVIDACTATLSVSDFDTSLADEFILISKENKKITLSTVGKSAHGSTPNEGVNAASILIPTLKRIEKNKSILTFLDFLEKCIGHEWDGKSLGIKTSDKESGDLTVNLGILKIADGKCEATIDIRFPVTKEGRSIVLALNRTAQKNRIFGDVESLKEPLYVRDDSELIKKLSQAFEMFRNEPCTTTSMGGGTYAKNMPNGTCVAFGGAGKGEHQANECVAVDELMECSKIIAQAMYNLAMK